ncbi:MAG TPA: gfo/Idh/MocA family oxidoreductase [Rhodospirillaceae bacterium]|nr:gfo/Idh/MocA family oxidoreductase [Rhodospirillaceae bacterium]
MIRAVPLRVAIVGLGWVALHRHLPSLMRSHGFQLVGVIDLHEGLAARTAKKYGLPFHAQTENLCDVPWLDQVDALTIAAPPAAHAPLVLAALAKGKHVLTEKPFATSVSDGEAMVAAAQNANKTLCVVHNFQFSRAAKKLQNDLQKNRLGAVKRITATQLGNPKRRLPSWYETLPLGLFYDESPHFFYLLHGLAAGALKLRHAYGVHDPSGMNTPSSINLLYSDDRNIPLTVSCQFDSALSEWHVMVTGEKATGLLDIFRDIYIRLPNDGRHNALQILRTSVCAFAAHFWQHIPNGLALLRGRLDYGNDEIMRRFAAAIRTGKPDDKIDAAHALAVLKLQHEATTALQSNMF